MTRRAGLAVQSIGTDPVAFAEFYRAHVDEVARFVARRAAFHLVWNDARTEKLDLFAATVHP